MPPSAADRATEVAADQGNLQLDATEINPLHASPGTPAYDDGAYAQPEPEPDVRQQPMNDAVESAERTGLLSGEQAAGDDAALADSQNPLAYDLEAILPSPAVAQRPGQFRREVGAFGGIIYPYLPLAFYVVGFAVLQRGLWTAAKEPPLRYSIFSVVFFCAWLAIDHRVRRHASRAGPRAASVSIDSIAREYGVDAQEMRALAETLGVDVRAEVRE